MAQQAEEVGRQNGQVGAQLAAYSLHAVAELLEMARIHRLTRHQHILFRLGELIAFAEGSASLAKRAARAARGEMNEKAHPRFNAEALAALSRIYAREVAMKIVAEGSRWIGGLLPETDSATLPQRIHLPEISRDQAGLIQDMDYVADVLYERI